MGFQHAREDDGMATLRGVIFDLDGTLVDSGLDFGVICREIGIPRAPLLETVDYWRGQGYEVGALWYNPNIHSYMEHQQRLEAMQEYARGANLPLSVVDSYDIIDYFRRVAGNEAQRCRHCFELRLSKTAEVAADGGFDAFTTTLLISPHQDQARRHRRGAVQD